MSSPAPNLSPTSFIAGSRTSFNTRTGFSRTPAASRSASIPSFFRCRIIQWIFCSGVMPAVGSSFSACALVPVAPVFEKYSIKRCRESGALLKTRLSASSRSCAEISAYGRMCAGFTIAASSPACTQWWRNTELSTPRASGVKPKLTRSEEHTSALQSPRNLVCRLLLEKKKNTQKVLEFNLRTLDALDVLVRCAGGVGPAEVPSNRDESAGHETAPGGHSTTAVVVTTPP